MHLSLGSEWGVGPPKGKASQPVTAAVVARFAALLLPLSLGPSRPLGAAAMFDDQLVVERINEKRD